MSSFAVIPAAYVYLRREDDAVLLLHRAGTGFMDGHWAGAAGHVEYGESVLAAAVRETHEELGIATDVVDLVPLCAMHRRHSEAAVDQRVDFFFGCRSWKGEPAVRETDKADGLDWFSLDALPHPVVPHEQVVLEHLRTGRVPPVLTYGF